MYIIHFIIILLLNGSLYLYSMDDQNRDNEYVVQTIEDYNKTLQKVMNSDLNDRDLLAKSSEQAGKLKACLELGLVKDQNVKSSIERLLNSHHESIKLFHEMNLLKAAINSSPDNHADS